MSIRVPDELNRLAHIFYSNKEKLYIVGGFVRNQIMGFPDKYNIDIDVCSSAKPEKIISMLKDTEFSVRYMNEDVGVLEIKGNIRVEHATFRREKYALPGVHLPNNVEFVDNLEIDALRRDFRCNAIYYDIINQEIIDPLDGIKDIEKKIIRTTEEPKIVFTNDAERILRMVRFAVTLGFKIDNETYNEAKNNVYKLKHISNFRKREEFSKIVTADTKYDFLTDIKYAHARGLVFLDDLDAIKYILPVLRDIKNSGLKADKNKTLYEHIINVFALSDKEVRLSALLHDVGKFKAKMEYGNFAGASELASVIIEKNLGNEGLGFSKKITERVKNVVFCADFNKFGIESAKNIKRFIIENKENLWLIIKLQNAIRLEKSNLKRKSIRANRLNKIYEDMISKGTPMSVCDLKIKGDVLITKIKNIRVNKISQLLKELLYKCVDWPAYNNQEDLLRLANKIVSKNKEEYLY